jgi:hypothetical protein
MKIQAEGKEMTGVWEGCDSDGVQFGLRPDGKSPLGRPKYMWKVMLRALPLAY